MKMLIKLELKRNKIRTYIIAGFIIAITMTCFLYLFAYAPMLEPDDADMAIFSSYDNIIPLFAVLNMAAYCVLSAVMYSKLIIEDYSGKRPVLLFSYPVSRKKVMLAKLFVVSIFTIISMIAGNLIIYLIFGVTERFLHLAAQDFTFSVLLLALETTFIMSLIASSIGLIAVGIGFIKKSVPTTIISAVLAASLLCNIVAGTASGRVVMYITAAFMIFAGALSSSLMLRNVESMEVA